MRILSTSEAFADLCLQERVWELLEITEEQWLSYCQEFKLGRLPITTIFGFLEKYGYEVAQERLWRKLS